MLRRGSVKVLGSTAILLPKLFMGSREDYIPDGNLKPYILKTSKPACLTQEVLHHLSTDLEERYFANLCAVLSIEQAFAGA